MKILESLAGCIVFHAWKDGRGHQIILDIPTHIEQAIIVKAQRQGISFNEMFYAFALDEPILDSGHAKNEALTAKRADILDRLDDKPTLFMQELLDMGKRTMVLSTKVLG
ncbi:hypothetical protein [Moraxella bovis]|uniref:Toxin-antitoxin system HicB family antitoxin n=1 Tax=Moraxella bovis TaxID=476 RepID=A0ABY6M2X5_MORBO|nr:hypothetical protein [Moraxella bovis]UZA02064.1 hypothetical protein LP092_08640 [Moraxella bovis]UZA18309.1 hypothetical protein LP088_08050 [Moraxella bovis]